MKTRFFKTSELNGSSYVTTPLRSNAILNIENTDKYCFLWSTLAHLHSCEKKYPNRVANYRHYFNELNIQGFDFTNGFECSDVHEVENLNNLPNTIFEINFYEDQNKWKII